MSEVAQPAVAKFDPQAFVEFCQEVEKERFINNRDPFIAGPGLSQEAHDAMMAQLLARIPQSAEETSSALK